MDAPDDAVLSLDELTVEFGEDDNMKLEIDYEDKAGLDASHIGLFSQNNTFSDAFDRHSFIVPKFIQNENDDLVTKMFDMKNSTCIEKEMLHPIPDCEEDIMLLSVLQNSKVNASCDSDSEFEVPERSVIPKPEMLNNKITMPNMDMSLNKTESETILQSDLVHSNETIVEDQTLLLQHEKKLPIQTTHGDSKNQYFSNAPKPSHSFQTVESVNYNSKSSQDYITQDESRYCSQKKKHQLSDDGTKQQLTIYSQPGESESDAGKHHTPSIVTTAEDWEGIQTVEAGFLKSTDKIAGPSSVIESKPLASFTDTWKLFQTADYSLVKAQIRTHIARRGFSALTHMLFGPPKLRKELLPQRELIFCVAGTQLDNDNETHISVLQTVYRCLTGSRFDCQRFGSHWEEIGFQGKDPATDLRGTGMLGLLNLLYFLQSPSTKALSRDVYTLSLHPTQNFPFCLMGINLTRICLQILREDVFNKECNTCRNIIDTVNNVYAALFLRLYLNWKKGKTIVDSGFVLQEIETYCRKQSKDIFRDVEAYEKASKQQGQSTKGLHAEPIFLNVCKDDKDK